MQSDISATQNVYGSGEVATLLNIKESTLRKYSGQLEKAGYKFHKNEKGHRGFFDRDVIALRKLIEIKSHPDMTLEQACNAVVSTIKDSGVSVSDTTDIAPIVRHDDRYTNEDIEELKLLVQQQTELIKEFSKRLDQQQQYFEERIKQDQKDRELMESLRESLRETKQQQLQIAAANQEEQRNKGFFARLFGK